MSRKRSKKNNRRDDGFKRGPVSAKTPGQKRLIEAIDGNSIIFCHGPAGTGKTHLAIGKAVDAMRNGSTSKIIISSPMVTTGDGIGFLPGEVNDKVGPYLRPCFDELALFAQKNTLAHWKESEDLEIVPLSMMRGRTFKYSYIILDEAQNATLKQLKSCLTRLGQNSKMIITGDSDQSDLLPQDQGALMHCVKNLKGISGIVSVQLNEEDIVRHELIGHINRLL